MTRNEKKRHRGRAVAWIVGGIAILILLVILL